MIPIALFCDALSLQVMLRESFYRFLWILLSCVLDSFDTTEGVLRHKDFLSLRVFAKLGDFHCPLRWWLVELVPH